MKYLFALLLLIHGLIHFMGFAKTYGIGNITQLTKEISKPVGILWLITTILFMALIGMYLLNKSNWPLLAFLCVAVSQVLIIMVWKDAKFGTIPNLIILFVAIAAFGSRQFELTFEGDVKKSIARQQDSIPGLLRESDIEHLPPPVQNYLRYTGALNQPKVKNMRIEFAGEMRSKKMDWFTFNSVQYNFFDEPERLFFMKGKMFGIEVPGYHCYRQAAATMDIRLFGMFTVVNAKGPEINKAETVTVFNDMCLMAPATLIDKRITWEAIDSLSVKAIFTNRETSITAILFFNNSGQLVNFISDDRYDINEMKQYRFSTPMKDYQPLNGCMVPMYGEAVWHYPEGEFVYGKFKLKSVEYNVGEWED